MDGVENASLPETLGVVGLWLVISFSNGFVEITFWGMSGVFGPLVTLEGAVVVKMGKSETAAMASSIVFFLASLPSDRS